ncbi:TrkH family potassium uptake protein [Treponema sp. OttesenSCG-928-L16]|nr:TrkH family potassium uptake protein [Treponema sp. OttesenSCG-928-L16]
MKLRFLQFVKIQLLILAFAALFMLFPLIVSLVYGEGLCRAYFIPMLIVLLPLGLVLFLTRGEKITLASSDGLLVVFSVWVLSALLGAFPYILSGTAASWTDAVFESVSGFTTTGATVYEDVESLPRSILLWRGLTHWLGGMGIVVLTVALLPVLGAGGFQMLRAESPGPESEKFTPRITETAKILWSFYVGFSFLQMILLMLGGMGWLDAAVHAFSTMSTGGFSTRNGSIASYRSPWIEWVCTVFMILAGFNFTLYFRLIRGKFRDVFNNTEAKTYVLIILLSAAAVCLAILPAGASAEESLRKGLFHTASLITTTGFAAADHGRWAPLAQGILFFLMFIGGCSGSTAGGVKVIRHVILFKQAGNELKKQLYPRGVFTISLNKKEGDKHLVYGAAGFVFAYLLSVLTVTLAVSSCGIDIFSSLNAALITIGNIGLGLAGTGPGYTFAGFPPYLKWLFSFVMIAGRLELWTALVFFSKNYWRS